MVQHGNPAPLALGGAGDVVMPALTAASSSGLATCGEKGGSDSGCLVASSGGLAAYG